MRRLVLTLVALSLLPAVPTRATGERVVVLPFANLTGKHEAFEIVLPAVYARLRAHGLEVVRHDEIRPVLRRHRIRALGEIGSDDAILLREETGARYAVLGSLDIYRPERTFEVHVSARVLDLESLELITATSRGLSVQETESWFASGRASNVESVMRDVLDPLTADLIAAIRPPGPEREAYHTCGLVALVPLDDYSSQRYAAEILRNLLMAELVDHGWQVVEPGFVREILLDEQRLARGGVSSEVQQILRNRLGVCWIVTGDLETFAVSPSGQEAATPSLNFGLRLIDARRSRLRAAVEVERDGADGEGLFGTGREYSMWRLARSCMEDVVEWMQREGDQ